MKLQQIWDELNAQGKGTDKGDVHSYIPLYEELLSKYQDKPVNVLEIGLFNGYSMLMWDRYFRDGIIYGIDCSETPHDGMADLRSMIRAGFDISIGNAENPEDAKKLFDGMKFDIIIEDAGHDFNQQMKIYETFKPYLAEGGIYLIEDIQDIDAHQIEFLQMDSTKTIKIFDRRSIKGRYDDVIVALW